MKASDLFVKCLENEGVEYIFGVPGEENADFMISLEDSKIKFILCRHEQGAAFMADVYGRLTGKCGVCLGTLGPGATNLVTGVADANMDRAPMVVLTGQADSKRLHKESHQNMDVCGMFKPLTKWTHTVLQPENIPEIVRKAFKLAETEKPGACHIELPEDIASMDVDALPVPPKRQRRPVPDEKIINEALECIRNSSRPIILAGNGAIRKRASKMLREFSKRNGISVINTFMGKGAVNYKDDTCLYTMGLQSKDYIACAMDAADTVITIGYDLVEYHPKLWNPKSNKKIIHIDFLPAEIDNNYKVTTEVVGDIAHSIWMLNERTKDAPLEFDLKVNDEFKQQMNKDFEEYKDDNTSELIKPQKVLWDVRQAMGPKDILLSDVGAHKMWIARYYQCEEPNTCLISNGFCTMGFALPGAIGAKMVYPDRNIVAICGDAGFLMNVQEMETAKRLGKNIVCIVWEDKAYGLIAWKQQNHFGKHTDLSFDNPDFVKLAESFGWDGVRVQNSKDLKGTIENAFKTNNPTLIVVNIDYGENDKLTKRLGKIAVAI